MRRAQREESQIVFTQAPVDYITGGTPVERTDTIVYNGADYPLEAQPDPRYGADAAPTNDTGYITRGQYQVGGWREANAERAARTIREMEDYIAQERDHERAIEEALEEYDTLRERAHRLNPVANGVTLVSEREYAQMERDGRLDPDMIYYTYPNTDDGITATWTERHPKIVKITYFIE